MQGIFHWLFKLKLHEITRNDGEALLLEMENKLLVKGYKFGILYCRGGQKNEDEMFGNGMKKIFFFFGENWLEFSSESFSGIQRIPGIFRGKSCFTGVE